VASETIRIGGLGPLSAPGQVSAGRELSDGMHLAVNRINEAGGVLGRPLELIFRDTGGTPTTGIAAVERLLGEDLVALAGEFHSVVASAIVEPIQRAGLPFVCASATLDAITARRLDRVFRLSPPQSRGWRFYADFVVARGFRPVILLVEPNLYWEAGARAVEARLAEAGVPFNRLTMPVGANVGDIVEQIAQSTADAPTAPLLLLLVAYPEPVRSVIRQLHGRGFRPPRLSLGDPAGRAGFPDWWAVVGSDTTDVPFLAYLRPGQLTTEGRWAFEQLTRTNGQEPTFVALEGYDSVLCLAAGIDAAVTTRAGDVCNALRRLDIAGTRDVIRFRTEPAGVVHQQWTWPPVTVLAFDTANQPFSQAKNLWDEKESESSSSPR
jgi:ABC-type branched-subunit amino acid transport system substrate-binding protein